MNDHIVIFGAGAIGRGLLADMVTKVGCHIVFVEATKNVAEKLQQVNGYKVSLVGRTCEQHFIDNYQVFSTTQEQEIIDAVAESLFMATAVGGVNLEAIAPIIAPGLRKRNHALNILVCENWPEADSILADALVRRGCEKARFTCVPCSVERMAKVADNGLDIVAESGQSLYVDGKSWTGPRPNIDELLFCDNIEAYYKRKLYTNNAGHVLLAYMGYLAGCNLLYQALEKPEIRRNLMELLDVASKALIECYGFDKNDIQQHVDNLVVWRFSNRRLADTIERIARNPLRKLGREERLVGLADLLTRCKLSTEPVARVIGAALNYRDPFDAQSGELENMLSRDGADAVLTNICGFDSNDTCYEQCLRFYQEYR